MTGRGLHSSATLLMSLLMTVIGVALIVEALAGGHGVSLLLIVGVLFIAAGAGRIYAERKRGSGA